MDKLRVAVFVEENSLPTEGGGYSYYQTLASEIDLYTFSDELEILYLLPSSSNSSYPFKKRTITARQDFTDRILYALFHKLYRFIHWIFPKGADSVLETLTEIISGIANRNAIIALRKEKIDLVYYLKPNDHPMNFPMIVTHWDVGHKSMYPFPEVASNGNYKKRETYYVNMLSKALLILCESAAGAAELKHYYPINDKKIKVLPLFGGEVVNLQVGNNEQHDILQKYGLKKDGFFLYPAQFWAHKNHFNLVVAFKQLLEHSGHEDLRLVLCGADQGNMNYIKDLVASLQMSRAVIFTGFINNRVLHTFYKNAISLVMPTYLGPTNLPLIEAAMLNCAVACSDLEGHHEILGDTGLYFDPSNATAITGCMNRMFDQPGRSILQLRALEHIKTSAFHVSKSLTVLERILLDIKPVRKAWGSLSGVLPFVSYADIGINNF